MFITFEGVEGSGKTTQLNLLSQFFTKNGIKHMTTREPGGSPIGTILRSLLLSEASKINKKSELLLYLTERSEHVEKVIKPALSEGKIVLCDRFSDATRAYQSFGRGIDRNLVEELIRFSTDGLEPDLTILLDIEPEKALLRARMRNLTSLFSEGRFEMEDLEFHKKVYKGYLSIAKEFPLRIKIVDANLEEGEVFQNILKTLILSGVINETTIR